MVYKNGNKELVLGDGIVLGLGTLLIAGATCAVLRVTDKVLEPLAKREDLAEVIDKTKNIVNLDNFRQKKFNSKK